MSQAFKTFTQQCVGVKLVQGVGVQGVCTISSCMMGVGPPSGLGLARWECFFVVFFCGWAVGAVPGMEGLLCPWGHSGMAPFDG